jgi:hypothetical protein
VTTLAPKYSDLPSLSDLGKVYVNIAQFAAIIGCGLSKARQLMDRGAVTVIKVDGCTRISGQSIIDFLERAPAYNSRPQQLAQPAMPRGRGRPRLYPRPDEQTERGVPDQQSQPSA